MNTPRLAPVRNSEERFHDEWMKRRLTIIDDQRDLAASANRIDMIIAVFAIGVLFGLWIA